MANTKEIKSKNNLKTRHNWIKNLLALIISAFFIAPFYITVSLSFKTRSDRTSYWLFPKKPVLSSYIYAWTKGNVGVAIKNTMIITVVSVFFILLFGVMAAYPFSRHKSKLNGFLLSCFVGVMMVPPLSVLVPLYKELVAMKGINTYWAVILITIAYQLPMCVFMFSNFIKTIPKELDEAAKIDGCSQFMILPRIILPNMGPVIASVLILVGVGVWNDYSFQLYVLQKPKMRTITLAMSAFFSDGVANMPAAAAAAVLAVLPVAIIYLCLQKYFVKGTVDSAIK